MRLKATPRFIDWSAVQRKRVLVHENGQAIADLPIVDSAWTAGHDAKQTLERVYGPPRPNGHLFLDICQLLGQVQQVHAQTLSNANGVPGGNPRSTHSISAVDEKGMLPASEDLPVDLTARHQVKRKERQHLHLFKVSVARNHALLKIQASRTREINQMVPRIASPRGQGQV